MGTLYITHPVCLLHEMGPTHPESPIRLQAIENQLIASGLMPLLVHEEAPAASRQQLLRVHSARYIEHVDRMSPSFGHVWLDPDTALNPHSLEAARHAAGAVTRAVDCVLSGQHHNAFCCVRPPGHHAEPDRAMGFCIFNNVAVGTAHALAAHGLRRVAIADFDVHHGNGTEAIFRKDDRVMFCSSFQHPFYPNSPISGDRPNMIHTPLPAGTGSHGFRDAVRCTWLPALDRFAPELLLISAGFDAHHEDDLAQLDLVESDYTWVTKELLDLADKHAGGRVVSVLEGGYAPDALGRSVAAHLRVLLGS